MSMVVLKKFGLNLSGRPQGIQAFGVIVDKLGPPYELDFTDIFSIGSSFADEVVAELARLNGGIVKVYNSNRIIQKCLKAVAKDKEIEILYL